ncbi:hypothetical protein LCGC14_1037670 [marine sediment metagenome]|uniref:Uncharacterized protein n=1 Tax=marine sediment metagenome TaxID=412755 RepID=A0A0F9MXC0_9ZZZZ
MKLTSKEICPITVRDRLVKNLAGQDVAVCDIVKALEWAEAKCLELNERNIELRKEDDRWNQYATHAKNLINALKEDIRGYKKLCVMADVPNLLIDNPTTIFGEKLTEDDLKWAKKKVEEYKKITNEQS